MGLLDRFKIKDDSLHGLKGQLMEKRALPQGGTEFEEWSDRIIAGAMVPTSDTISLKYALANMIMHIPATEDHREDAFFIKQLRKSAANQVAHAKIEEYKNVYAERIAKNKLEVAGESPNT